jgi:heat shock protein HtpX
MLIGSDLSRLLGGQSCEKSAEIRIAISRAREFGADETGAHISNDPEALASALERLEAYSRRISLPVDPAVSHLFIVKPMTGFPIQNLFSAHPPTAERVTRLRRIAQQMAPRSAGAHDWIAA